MRPVLAVVLHPEPDSGAGPLVRAVAQARRDLADDHRAGFAAAGADVRIVAGRPDGQPFGGRLRALADDVADGGLVVLGSGAVPLLRPADRRRFVAVAGSDDAVALANNRYSADIVALARAAAPLRAVPPSITDNALPRWLVEEAGVRLDDLGRRWRLGVDIDGPLDLVLLGAAWSRVIAAADRALVEERLAAVRRVAADPRAELVVAGRTSAATVAWLARATAARTRAIVEERGLRTRRPGQRAPASILGTVIDRDGPQRLGEHLARLGEAAVVDTRVLLAHRLGADEAHWPAAEDRFASDLLLHERIVDPWLRALTKAAASAPIPVVLGGHGLVGPGLRLALRRRARVRDGGVRR